jgi:anhydro-N-acetylmuramic acid kinase
MVTTYNVIGVMSGTSLDGMDIAWCRFELKDGQWKFEIPHATTLKYNHYWAVRLMLSNSLSARNLAKLNADYGHFIGKKVKDFIRKHNISADFIASHGQTVFHEPQNQFTVQIGSGAAIAAETGMTVVCDFRSADVALGGQGAPLVPIGDKLLFGEYDACLNIGGFANISYAKSGRLIANDICPANVVLNFMAGKLGKKYDAEGRFAGRGKLIEEFLDELNELDFYKQKPPKSLGIEWIKNIDVLLEKYKSESVYDQIRTLTEHIAMQIAIAIRQSRAKTILSTGGGTHNTFLVNRIQALCGNKLLIPPKEIIDYKEALIFGLLGVLRMRNEVNCLKSATGASRDSCGGAIYGGN